MKSDETLHQGKVDMFGSAIRCAAVAGVFAVAASSSAMAQAQPQELKFANFITTTSITYTGALRQWTDDLNAKLAGRYQVRGYYGGTLGRNPAQYSKMVRDGVADIAFVTFGESASIFPDTTVLEVPFVVTSALEGSLAHWRLHKKMPLVGYDDFHWLALTGNSPYLFHFAKPITDLASLANRKVRGGGRIQTQIIERLGMTPVSGPITSSAEALNRGTWDGAYLDFAASSVFGVHKVAKNHYDLRLSSIGLGIAMNKQVYESMDSASRKAIDELSGERLTRILGVLWDGEVKNINDEIAADKEARIVQPTAADLEKVKRALEPVRQEWLAASPRNPMVLEAINQITAEIRAGK